ncbi:unnamed protein product [Peniophora sp. CBMAI 1063]|nr:unnamed protein product [Peniophora sp. CBMAI 1063]
MLSPVGRPSPSKIGLSGPTRVGRGRSKAPHAKFAAAKALQLARQTFRGRTLSVKLRMMNKVANIMGIIISCIVGIFACIGAAICCVVDAIVEAILCIVDAVVSCVLCILDVLTCGLCHCGRGRAVGGPSYRY